MQHRSIPQCRGKIVLQNIAPTIIGANKIGGREGDAFTYPWIWIYLITCARGGKEYKGSVPGISYKIAVSPAKYTDEAQVSDRYRLNSFRKFNNCTFLLNICYRIVSKLRLNTCLTYFSIWVWITSFHYGDYWLGKFTKTVNIQVGERR